MAIGFRQVPTATGIPSAQHSLTCSFAAPTVAGSVIAVAGMYDPIASGVTITDDKGDTPTLVLDFNPGRGSHVFCYAFLTPASGVVTVTATYSGTNPTYGDLFLWEITGLTNPRVDKTATASAGSGTVADSGSTGTLSAANEAAIAYVACGFFGAVGTGWTQSNGVPATGSGAEHRILSSTAAINGTFTVTPAWNAVVATFMSGTAVASVGRAAAGGRARAILSGRAALSGRVGPRSRASPALVAVRAFAGTVRAAAHARATAIVAAITPRPTGAKATARGALTIPIALAARGEVRASLRAALSGLSVGVLIARGAAGSSARTLLTVGQIAARSTGIAKARGTLSAATALVGRATASGRASGVYLTPLAAVAKAVASARAILTGTVVLSPTDPYTVDFSPDFGSGPTISAAAKGWVTSAGRGILTGVAALAGRASARSVLRSLFTALGSGGIAAVARASARMRGALALKTALAARSRSAAHQRGAVGLVTTLLARGAAQAKALILLAAQNVLFILRNTEDYTAQARPIVSHAQARPIVSHAQARGVVATARARGVTFTAPRR